MAVVSGPARDQAIEGFSKSGMMLAERRVQEGKFAEAEAICREVLSTQYDPNYRPAMLLLARLQEPGQINKTLGPKFIAKVEEVTSSTPSSFRGSNFATPAFAKRSTSFVNKRPRTILQPKGAEA